MLAVAHRQIGDAILLLKRQIEIRVVISREIAHMT